MNYLIKKFDGTSEVVPEKVAEAIFAAKTPKVVWVSKAGGKRMIAIAEVSDISPENEPVKHLSLPAKTYTKVEALKALQEIVKGLKKFISRNPAAEKAKAILLKMEQRIAKIEKMKSLNTNLNTLIK